MCFKEESYGQALSHYTNAIRLNSKNGIYFCNRALVYFKMGDLARSVEDCNSSIQKDPRFVKAYYRKALALYSMPKTDWNEACLEAKKTIELGLAVLK